MFTIGYEVPGHSNDLICIRDGKSLMDADFLLIEPNIFTTMQSDSDHEAVLLFEKEIEDFLKCGKNIFVFLSEKVSYGAFDNYSFLPINMGALTSARRRAYKFFWKLYFY